MFLDEAQIEVIGGHGGRGCVAFRREKYVAKGGPNGGDGGKGADIILLADANTDTLSDFASRKKFEAPKGIFGMGSNKNGKDGEDLILRVPPGTLVTDPKTGELIVDLQNNGDQFLLVRGGRGGYGNAHFKSSTRQTPDFAELGEPGEKRKVKLELKLVADVGIIGYPSVGKSTLISVISAAKPKIADYPFTTLVPNLGVVNVDDRSYIVCDVPGLIEGASEGKGLGGTFLKHIERCGILLHVLDVSRALTDGKVDVNALMSDYQNIRKELETYSPTLSEKSELIILNKIDLIQNADEVIAGLESNGLTVFDSISAATTKGTQDLIKKLLPIVLEERQKRQVVEDIDVEELPVLKPHLASERMGAYHIDQSEEDVVVVTGKRLEQFVKMTDFSQEGGIRRFRDVLDRIGLTKALKRIIKDNSIVRIADIEVQEYL